MPLISSNNVLTVLAGIQPLQLHAFDNSKDTRYRHSSTTTLRTRRLVGTLLSEEASYCWQGRDGKVRTTLRTRTDGLAPGGESTLFFQQVFLLDYSEAVKLKEGGIGE